MVHRRWPVRHRLERSGGGCVVEWKDACCRPTAERCSRKWWFDSTRDRRCGVFGVGCLSQPKARRCVGCAVPPTHTAVMVSTQRCSESVPSPNPTVFVTAEDLVARFQGLPGLAVFAGAPSAIEPPANWAILRAVLFWASFAPPGRFRIEYAQPDSKQNPWYPFARIGFLSPGLCRRSGR